MKSRALHHKENTIWEFFLLAIFVLKWLYLPFPVWRLELVGGQGMHKKRWPTRTKGVSLPHARTHVQTKQMNSKKCCWDKRNLFGLGENAGWQPAALQTHINLLLVLCSKREDDVLFRRGIRARHRNKAKEPGAAQSREEKLLHALEIVYRHRACTQDIKRPSLYPSFFLFILLSFFPLSLSHTDTFSHSLSSSLCAFALTHSDFSSLLSPHTTCYIHKYTCKSTYAHICSQCMYTCAQSQSDTAKTNKYLYLYFQAFLV